MSTPNPAIGQRWLSDAETELGLGMVIEVNPRTVTILFPKSEETRVYARQNAPLSRIRFVEGDTLTDTDNKEWTVTAVIERQHVLRYEVVDADGQTAALAETRLSPNVHLSRPSERLLACQLDNNEWYELRVMALRARDKLAHSPVSGLVGPRVGLIPHQFYIAREVASRLAPRVLLADEVGLGKTIEAGLIIHQQLLTGRAQRVLVLVPEIGLTPQIVSRFKARFATEVALLHSGLTERERLKAWRRAFTGHAGLVIGTRSALFTPMPHLGLIIVDEEHDLSFKQQEGFRYHARDLAVMRGQLQGCPVVLGSATPSLESLGNAAAGRYEHLRLTERAASAQAPDIKLIDLRGQKLRNGLTDAMHHAIAQRLKRNEQVLVFINRRGFARCCCATPAAGRRNARAATPAPPCTATRCGCTATIAATANNRRAPAPPARARN